MRPSDNEIEMLATGFATQHRNGLIRFAHAVLDAYTPQASAEAVRNAALDQAAEVVSRIRVMSNVYGSGYPRSRPENRLGAIVMAEAVTKILALKSTPAPTVAEGDVTTEDFLENVRSLADSLAGCAPSRPQMREAARLLQDFYLGQRTRLESAKDTDDVALPSLPQPLSQITYRGGVAQDLFGAADLRAYARAAVLADRRERCAFSDILVAELAALIPVKDVLAATSSGKAMIEYFRAALAARKEGDALSATQTEQGERDA